jgi:GNAT superfamily N-acetyltransferase
MIEIRQASAADASALAALRWEFRAGREPAVESENAFLARCAVWMRDELASGRWRAWVATRDGDIVGQVWVNIIPKLPNPVGESERHLYLSNLFVAPNERGGVGTRLLERALDYARAEHMDRVLLWPSARSVSLYERYGFSRHADVMELNCSGRPPRAPIA